MIIATIYDKSGALLTQDNATTGVKTDFISLAGQTFVRVKNGVTYYPINDHLGTAFMEADQNGNIPASKVYNYNPFGENINHLPFFATTGNDPGNNNEQGFTGHIEDKTGLVYMQARYYDPVIGRFLSTDPIGYADQLNLYAYVGNDPVNKVDPDGKIARLILKFIPKPTPRPRPPKTEPKPKADKPSEQQTEQKPAEATQSKPELKEEPYRPNRPLPRDKNGNPVPDVDVPHTQLGTKKGRNGEYTQAREWEKGPDGKLQPKRDIDFTDHGRSDHPNPHQHKHVPNPTGGTPQHGPAEPLEIP